MKKQGLLLAFLFFSSILFAQVSDLDRTIANSLVNASSKEIGLTKEDLANYVVSSSYYTPSSGLRMVYLNQAVLGKTVHNQMLVLAYLNNKLVSKSGSFLTEPMQRINVLNGNPKQTAAQAVQSALRYLKLSTQIKIVPQTTDGILFNFGTLGISDVAIKAHLVWQPVQDKWLNLAWEIEIAPTGSADHWMIRVDALNGEVLDQNNYTVHERLESDIIERNEALTLTEKSQTLNVIDPFFGLQNNSPQVVSNADYRVIPYPAESPLHTGGTAAVVTNPWTLAPGNATSLLWHYDGTTYHDSTRGNNVWAQEDRDNSNTTFGRAGVSSTARPNLTLTTAPDYTVAPTTSSFQQFAITNLFYWNNILHDICYLYGFNEVSGNFQNNNQARGGAGADYVIADAQDAAGTNNANFSTPTDGNRPRMQMYLSTYNTPNRDGDLDNGVIAHEYGHGISNRFTGGPANSSCLSNAEQGGEGWSDYIALMTTTNWATANANDGTIARPIGTYLFGQAPTGGGIRTYPYSTNMSVNPNTYAMMTASTGVHRIGEIWCSALWDMTWEIIGIDGINTNLFNPAGVGGNSVAMRLVMEGMRLQPCSPGYIDARNAILRADSILYSGKYNCAIWKAFSRRGMGRFASQGSSASTSDQVVDFTDGGSSSFKLTQSVQSQQEGLLVTYRHSVKAGQCAPINNHTIRDTLPSNVTYVSGGTYDATSRVVQFNVNLATNQAQDYAFTVRINSGSYFTPLNLIKESVDSPTIQPFWTSNSTTTTVWDVSTAQKVSAPYAFFSPNSAVVSDQLIAMTNAFTVPANPPALSFMGYINSESTWDGGVVEITNDNGTTWTDLGSSMTSGGYTSTLNATGLNPIRGRSAFNGNSGGFVKTVINMASFAGQSVKVRFRFGSDASLAVTGWYIDDISMSRIAQVNIKSLLFNNNNQLVASLDTFTLILPPTDTCQQVTIQNQPVGASVCSGTNASFNVIATGSGIQYQWQVSTNNGTSFSNLVGENTATLQLNTSSLTNGNQYRCLLSGTCTQSLFTNAATLTIWALPATPLSGGGSRCGTGIVTLLTNGVTNATSEWYAAPNGGSVLSTGNSYIPTVVTTTTYYLGSVDSKGCRSAIRNPVTATVITIPAAPSTTGATTCQPASLTLTASTSPNFSIDWYSTQAGGSPLLSGSTQFSTPVLNNTTTYFAEARNLNCVSSSRTAAIAAVRQTTTSQTSIARCASAMPFTWNGNTYTTAGTYTVVLTNTSGCDSSATLLLTVLQSSSSSTKLSICSKQLPYVWNGLTFTQGGTQSVTLTAPNGCDSVASLTLTVLPNSSSNSNLSICANQLPYTWNGLTFSQAGTQTAALIAANGCDSLAALTLTVLSNGTSTTSISICSNQLPYIWNGLTFTQAGTQTVTLNALNGCDSLATLNLTVTPNRSSSSSISICSNELPYIWNGLTFTQAGTQTATLNGSNGCDSLATLILTINTNQLSSPSAVTQTLLDNSCGARVYRYIASSVSNATGYNWTLPSGMGIVTVDSGNATSSAVIRLRYASNAAAATTDSIRVNAYNSCSSGLNRTVILTNTAWTQLANPTITATNLVTNVCGGRRVRYAIPQPATTSGNVSIEWSIVGNVSGASAVIDSGSTSSRVIVVRYANNAASNATDSIRVRYNYNNGCSFGAFVNRAIALPVLNPPAAPTITTTNIVTNICGSRRVRYAAPALPVATTSSAAATGYEWSLVGTGLSSNYVVDSGTLSSRIVVIRYLSNAAAATTDSVRCRYTSGCGFSPNARFKNNLTLLNPPTAPTITTTNVVTNICGGRKVRYAAPALPAATSTRGAASGYEWSLVGSGLSSNFVVDSGTLSSRVLVIRYLNNTAAAASDSIRCRFTSGCGFSAYTRFKNNLSALNPPAAPTTLTGLTAICPIVGTLNGTTYTSSSVTGVLNYVWSIPTGAVIDSGSNGLKIRVRFISASTRDTIQVQANNGCLSAKRSLPLNTSGCATNFTGKSITTASGVIAKPINIYPNPSTSDFHVQLPFATNKASIRVFNTNGALVEIHAAISGTLFRLGKSWKPGTYLIECRIDGIRSVQKLIKQ